MTADSWQPGDPVYADQAPTIRYHCGPCLVAWTANVDRCPDCGELSTEALRASVGRVRSLCAANISHSEMFPSEPLSPREVLHALDCQASGGTGAAGTSAGSNTSAASPTSPTNRLRPHSTPTSWPPSQTCPSAPERPPS